ncbi:unnamed protein product [Boreogadus saida]
MAAASVALGGQIAILGGPIWQHCPLFVGARPPRHKHTGTQHSDTRDYFVGEQKYFWLLCSKTPPEHLTQVVKSAPPEMGWATGRVSEEPAASRPTPETPHHNA